MIKKNGNNKEKEEKFNELSIYIFLDSKDETNRTGFFKKENNPNKQSIFILNLVNQKVMKLFEKSLMAGIINLYQNNLSIKELIDKKIIPPKPYYLPSKLIQ